MSVWIPSYTTAEAANKAASTEQNKAIAQAEVQRQLAMKMQDNAAKALAVEKRDAEKAKEAAAAFLEVVATVANDQLALGETPTVESLGLSGMGAPVTGILDVETAAEADESLAFSSVIAFSTAVRFSAV